MTPVFPFHSGLPATAEAGVFHTHPRCRVGQGIGSASRVAGPGEGRRECPFCFIMRQFQANRTLRGHGCAGVLAGGAARLGEGPPGAGPAQPCPGSPARPAGGTLSPAGKS